MGIVETLNGFGSTQKAQTWTGFIEKKESRNNMLLAQSRKEFWEQYQNGQEPPVLTDYRKYRDSEEWRTSRTVEQLCEIILKLEEQKESRHE